jgi:hypothetical protein
MAAIDRQFVDALMEDDDIRALEAEYPGIVHASWTEVRPVMADMLRHDVPRLWDVLAGIYERRLTVSQIEAATSFFASPTGRKVIALMNRNADLGPAMREVVADDQAQVTEKNYTGMVMSSAARTVREMSAAEVAEMTRFTQSPAGLALQALIPEAKAAGVAWMNESDPEVEARFGKAIDKAMNDYMKKHPAKPAKGG